MTFRPTRRAAAVATAVALVLGLVAVVGYVLWPRAGTFEKAISMLPQDTLRVTYTDWAGLRAELDAGDVDEPGPDAREFLAAALDRELTVSSLASSSDLLQRELGFSPLAAEWEVLGQSREGMVVILRLEQDLGAVADKLEAAGWSPPGEDRMAGGVWEGGSEEVARTGLSTYELSHVAFDEERGLLIASDAVAELEKAVPVAQGDEDGLDAGWVADAAEEPLAATVFLEDYACEALSLSSADEAAQAVAADLVDQAGGVSPVGGYLVAAGRDRSLTLAWRYGDEGRAERDAESRSRLAGAEDPGQYLSYPEVFTVDEVRTDGGLVVLDATLVESASPMSALAEGPVLLASC